jgi:anti-sigma factor RsiW
VDDQYRDQLPFYVAGTLPEGERSNIEQHVVMCNVCTEELSLWRTLAVITRASAQTREQHLPSLSSIIWKCVQR